MKEELRKAFSSTDGKKVLICNPEYWPALLGMKGMHFSFRDYSELHFMVDEQKVESLFHKEGLPYAILKRIIEKADQNEKPPYWINLPSFIRQFLTKTRGYQLKDMCSLPFANTLTNNSILCLSPGEFIEEPVDEGEVVFVDDRTLENASRKVLARFSHEELKKYWDDPYLWKQFSSRRGVVKLSEESGVQLIHAFDPERRFQHHWVEHTGGRSYRLWAAIGARFFEHFFQERQFRKIPLEQLIGDQRLRNKVCLRFKTRPELDPRNRVIALNPESSHRDIYWTLLIKKIREFSLPGPSVLFVLDPEELEPLTDIFKANLFFVPKNELSISRKLELVSAKGGQKSIAIFPFSMFNDVVKWIPEGAFTIFLEALPLEENTVWMSKEEKQEEEEVLDNDMEASDRDIELESDTFHKIQSYLPNIHLMEFRLRRNNPNHRLIFLDPRLLDYVSIRHKLNLRVNYVPEYSDLDEFEKDLEISRNLLASSEDRGEINTEEVIPVLEEIFIQGYEFRSDQRAYLERILPANENLVVTLPTGGGKSVLFEAPALYRGAIYGRLTLIISPLKALMEDHFDGLIRKGFFASIDYINQDKGLEVQDIYRRVAGGEILFLYITPERFKSMGFVSALNQRLRVDDQLEYAVFDEAHCISQWGNEFRPDYHRAANEIQMIRE